MHPYALNEMHIAYIDLFIYLTVIIMCASPSSVRDIMLEAHNLKFTNGEYIFFNIDLFGRWV